MALAVFSSTGHGELHYNLSFDTADKKEIDFHRFVLEFGHDFTDSIHFAGDALIRHRRH